MTKKRKPQDATLRNIRGKATKTTLQKLTLRVARLEQRVAELAQMQNRWSRR